MADDCKEEVWSWWYYKPEQIDPYWIRCTLMGPHEQHEDSNTGLTWKRESVERDEYMAVPNTPRLTKEEIGKTFPIGETFTILPDDYADQTSEVPFPPAEYPEKFIVEPGPVSVGGPFMAAKENTNYPERARALVYDYVKDRLEKTDTHVIFGPDEVYTVWFCKTLKNWKALISTTLADGMYYEVTYNGEKGEAYIDAYKKFENVKVLDSTLY